MDVLSPENRHKNMSHIRSKDTKPEKQIRSALWKAGFRYRICDKRYPGKPDLIFPRYYAVDMVSQKSICKKTGKEQCPGLSGSDHYDIRA